jgi:hypothetical protein
MRCSSTSTSHFLLHVMYVFRYQKKINFILAFLLCCACSSAEAGQGQYVELLHQLLAAQGATLEVRACTAKRV